jgi:hypothetical protein
MRLRVLNLGQDTQAPLPMPDGALYRHPNPDGSRKRCGNCIMFVASENACVIHRRDQDVLESDVCGYHVYGRPLSEWMDHPGIAPVTPDLSGLRPAGPGVSCASCRFYQDQGAGKGLCWGVSKSDDRRPPQPVEALGWCARYEAR